MGAVAGAQAIAGDPPADARRHTKTGVDEIAEAPGIYLVAMTIVFSLGCTGNEAQLEFLLGAACWPAIF